MGDQQRTQSYGEAVAESRFELSEEERQFDAEALSGTVLPLLDLDRVADACGLGRDRYAQ
jgi:hypothetical protein